MNAGLLSHLTFHSYINLRMPSHLDCVSVSWNTRGFFLHQMSLRPSIFSPHWVSFGCQGQGLWTHCQLPARSECGSYGHVRPHKHSRRKSEQKSHSFQNNFSSLTQVLKHPLVLFFFFLVSTVKVHNQINSLVFVFACLLYLILHPARELLKLQLL